MWANVKCVLVQLYNLFILETELQSDRLLSLLNQVSCWKGVSASSSTVFPRTCSLDKQEEEKERNTFCNPWSTLDPSYLFWQWSPCTQFLLLKIQTVVHLWHAVCVAIWWKAALGIHGLCTKDAGSSSWGQHLIVLVLCHYCGGEHLLVLGFLLFLNQNLHAQAGLS